MRFDFLVVGSGIAGLSFALKASSLGSVCVITKKKKVDTATNLAQGGIAAVLDATDSFEDHVRDTLLAGAGLCDRSVVEMVVKKGPERVRELAELGVSFVKDGEGKLSLGREGGHSHRRVAHAYDLTGKQIELTLIDNVGKCENIVVLENHMCIDLLIESNDKLVKKCIGAFVLNEKTEIVKIFAKNIVLCTGGAGKVYLYTSNPDIATGDGVAVACRAGAVLENMEFVQFHPTCLFHHKAKNFLISEAVRGEGAILRNEKGERFLEKYEPDFMELATRDKVARAIDKEMKITGADCVYLDLTAKDVTFIKRRFPAIYEKCISLGIDIAKEMIPVVPAAHYLCGGVKVDNHGRTSIPGLFSLGETSCTGLHGGNRLASNSLLEAVVYADNAYNFCRVTKSEWDKEFRTYDEYLGETSFESKVSLDEEIRINHNWDIIRRTMWDYVGIVRRTSRLYVAQHRIAVVRSEIEELVKNYRLTTNMLELRNISLVASLIIDAALQRKESRGLHFILDYPEASEGRNIC